jgi:hypothetical protein
MSFPSTSTTTFYEFRRAFELGLSEVHKDELKRLPKLYQNWLREVDAKRFYDTDWSVSGLGIMPPKEIGGEFSTDQILQGDIKTYELATYGLMLVIQKEAYEYDLYGVIKGMVGMLAKSATDRYNLVAYSVWNNAFNPPNDVYKTFQGEALIKLAHSRMDGGSWKNRPTKNIGLSYLALMQARIDMRKWTDERGRFIQMKPERLICGVDLEWLADTVLHSEYRPGNANMELNVARKMNLDIHSEPYVTSVTAFFVLANKMSYKIAMRLSAAPDFQTENRPATRDRMYSSYTSFGLGIYNSLGTWGSSGDGATST